ncbi:kinesin-like protein Klp6 [Schizosaccharomyces cryophilus OY26]|uniref:Kinesin-like protein n=1 Tax=Schizosaccharomyces cryophilus (strain OY26 / ATCC MYA-4695 / CBS 11777 / NBRC 106824 / NRRL Y48691) TaxID=653667 RepID=S9VRC7_SCHCR|nr:kinesin-like protein Klp6 [Schizosaccharomyces cryophilus OY26]EPY50503.1 kinesin-like protein Klp6 [Schizosaccharomyces cryophilus OY26]
MKNDSSIFVAVRVRPFTEQEKELLVETPDSAEYLGDGSLAGSRSSTGVSEQSKKRGIRRILRVLDDNVLIFDPPEENPLAGVQKSILSAGKRFKDLRFAFDRLFHDATTQEEVYQGTSQSLLDSVLDGYNATVFAYGATGCGKTHTISGEPNDPGIIFLTMRELLTRIESLKATMDVELSVSYLEIYNEKIRDLLSQDPMSLETPKSLTIREDADQNISVPGLTYYSPKDLQEVMDIIVRGNNNRTMSPTEANAVSSRSHAVLQIYVHQTPRSNSEGKELRSVFSFIDLAGSERASATKNRGDRLVEGANINRSLLALGNCINSLCDQRRRPHIPYRDSKLTRLLKFSLGGNCKTVMIVCVSPSSQHYDETHNTLKYGNRAKNIKTKVSRNTVSVDRHVSEYVRVIYELRQRVSFLQKRISEESNQFLSSKEARKISSREVRMLEARNILKASFDGSRDLQKDLIHNVRTLRKLEDEILLSQFWIAQAENNETITKEELDSMKTRLENLYSERTLIFSKVNPDEICKIFVNSISHIISSFKAEGDDLYADMLQDEVDLLKSIVENQILDARSEAESLSNVTKKMLQNMFSLLPLLPEEAIDTNEYLASAFDQLVGISPSRVQFKVTKFPPYSKHSGLASMNDFPHSPSRFKARSPSKAARVLKKPLKKRVRFSEMPLGSPIPASNSRVNTKRWSLDHSKNKVPRFRLGSSMSRARNPTTSSTSNAPTPQSSLDSNLMPPPSTMQLPKRESFLNLNPEALASRRTSLVMQPLIKNPEKKS